MSETTTVPLGAGSTAVLERPDVATPTAEELEAMVNGDHAPEFHKDMNDEELKKALGEVQVVDVTDGMVANAIDYAEAHIKKDEGSGALGFARKIWSSVTKRNIVREFVRDRRIRKGRKEIERTGNLYVMQGKTQADHDRSTEAVVNRFTSEYDLLHHGENNEALDRTEHGRTLASGIRNLVRGYANGSISTAEELKEEKAKLLKEFGKQAHPKDRNRGVLYADNVLKVAEHAKAASRHGIAMDRIDRALGFKVGEARMGVRTEAKLTGTDRAVDALYSKFGSKTGGASCLINETTLGVVASSIAVGLKLTTSKAVTAAAIAGTAGLATGAIAGVRERYHMTQDRSTHSREMAEGGDMSSLTNAKRREKLEKTRYETKHVNELIGELAAAVRAEAEPGARLRSLIEAVSQAETRIRMSDEKKVDLIQYSGKVNVEEERLKLDIAVAKAKVILKKQLAEADDTTLLVGGAKSKDLDETLNSFSSEVQNVIGEKMTERDKAFKSLRRKEMLKMAAVAAVSGTVVGMLIQEGLAAASDSTQGVFESSSPSAERQTLLAGIFHGHEAADGSSINMVHVNGHADVSLPPGYHLTEQHGTWQLADAHNDVIDKNVTFDAKGQLSDATRHALSEKGYTFDQTVQHTEGKPTPSVTHVSRTPEGYMKAHPEQFTKVHHVEFMDNNTPGTYEGNEQREYFSVNAKGDYVVDISSMTPSGSFHDGVKPNVQELIRQGKMTAVLQGEKGQPSILLHFDKHGHAIINKNSFAGHTYFSTDSKGKWDFHGHTLAISENIGKRADGSVNLRTFATVIGDGKPRGHFLDTVHEGMKPTAGHDLITTAIHAPVHELPVEIPPILPIYGRGGLGELAKDSPADPEFYGGYYGYSLRQMQEHWAKERSPRLARNPDANLDTGEELRWYVEEQRRKRGEEYVDEIEGNIDGSDVLKNIGNETKAIVCMPVAAANESENIYKTLTLYAQQDPEAQHSTVILMNLNWKEEDANDPAVWAKIQKTHDEIERARTDFPDLRIATFNKVWTPEFIEQRTDEKGNVRLYGEVIKNLYDTAAFSFNRAVVEGRRESAAEAVLITNDADAQGMSRNYLARYIEDMENNPTVDVFTGLIRWGTAEFEDYPGYGLASGIYAVLNMATQRPGSNRTALSTTGPNAGFRLSAYAAAGGCEDNNRMGAGADAVLGQRVVAGREGVQNLSGQYAYPGSSSSYGSNGASTRPAAASNGKRAVTKHVGGAQIDTLADRLLGAYRQGKWIAAGWAGFDTNGYEDRGVSAAAGTLPAEDPQTDIEGISDRVRISVEGFINYWYREPGTAAGALALYFGTKDEDGNPLYTAEWSGKPGWDGDGTFKFEFTEAGKRWLQKRLLEDSKGRPESYGRRLQRQLYNRTRPGEKPPKFATPRFVQHTTQER